ncbi:putative S-adenosylmethionine-dependent methyltransferase [mine drainage metagenome]|uniref:Putative S-adenosylmethionine-dependent methyltransferase n=1 Tax=mine drainage metagenome TaxID=410659 RepID=A0A1J5TG97_9ZZZZ
MNCPLCSTKESLIAKRTNMADLRTRWNSAFGFDPFPSDYSHDHIDKKKCSTCHLEFFDSPYYGDADFYSRISKNSWYYEQSKWEFDVAAEIVSKLKPKDLLEIGCGNGFFLEKISALGSNVEGVDINKDAVASCKTRGLKVEAGDVFDITRSYDMVVLFQVLEHMENAKELFEFLTTKLVRPGGFLIIAVPNPDGYLKEMDINLLDMPPHHNSCWGLSTFEYLNTQFGLQLIEHKKETIRYVHYLGFLQNVIGDHAKLTSASLMTKMFFKLQSLVVRMLAPLTYVRDRNQIDGQTHLVVLKNVR